MENRERKIWLITGISSGLGKALAAEAMKAGDQVVGTFRSQAQVDAFNAANENGVGVLMDVTEEKQVSKAVVQAVSLFGRIDVLVNNAGLGFVGAIEETSVAELRALFEANFFGAFRMTQLVLPHMREQGSGHIIQISSHGGLKAFAGFGAYNASKFALEGFSEAMAQEVEALGIKVSIIEPGPFRTNFASDNLGMAAKEISAYADTAGSFRTKLKSADGKQEGDPVKAASAIFELAYVEHPPLRLPLGKTALMTIGMKLESVQADLDSAREVAAAVVY